MDGKVFKVKDAVIGKTLPPLHPFDRCIIVRHVEATSEQTRFARDMQGNGIKVPAGTTYEQWAAQQGPDKVQYEEYRKLLGENPFTVDFATFQQAKYSNSEAYALLKLDYRRRSTLAADPTLALPMAETATIAPEKFTGYIFNPENVDGWAKGVAFESHLGYNVSNWEALSKAIMSGATQYPCTLKGQNMQGARYEQRMILYGIRGMPANVVVGWLAELTSTHMTTAYIKEVTPNDRND